MEMLPARAASSSATQSPGQGRTPCECSERGQWWCDGDLECAVVALAAGYGRKIDCHYLDLHPCC